MLGRARVAVSREQSRNADTTRYRPVVSITDRARAPRVNRSGAAVCALERSPKDPTQTLHPDDDSVRRHGWPADDHSAPAILRKRTGRIRNRDTRPSFRNRNYLRIYRSRVYRRTIDKRSNVGALF